MNNRIKETILIVNKYQFWRHDNKPVELCRNKVIDEKINYVHQNPVEEGLVFSAEDYLYSSAADYAEGKRIVGRCYCC